MPHYLFKASYTAEGVRGVAAGGGGARREAVTRMFESNGGKLESLYFAFGDADVYAFGELPDNEAALALAIAVNSTDHTTVSTVVLATPEEVDAATKRSVDYTPPGG